MKYEKKKSKKKPYQELWKCQKNAKKFEVSPCIIYVCQLQATCIVVTYIYYV